MPWLSVYCGHSPGFRHPVAVVDRHLSVCRVGGRLPPSVACLVAPCWCAPLRAVESLAVRRLAFLLPWCLSLPGAYALGSTGRLRGARRARPRTRLMACAAGARRGVGAGLAPRHTCSGRALALPLAGPLLRCSACVDFFTHASGYPCRPSSDGVLAGAPGLFCVHADTSPFASVHAPGSRARVFVHALLGRVWWAGLLGAFWCASSSCWLFSLLPLSARPLMGRAALISFSLQTPARSSLPERFFPRHCVKTSAVFSKGADLGIIRTPFLQLAHKVQAQHTHTNIGRYGKGSVPRPLLRGKRFSEPQQLP